MLSWLLIAALVVLFVTGMWAAGWHDQYHHLRRANHFEVNRPPVAFEKWYHSFYGARDPHNQYAEHIETILNMLGKCYGIEPTSFRPSDSFGKELGPLSPLDPDDPTLEYFSGEFYEYANSHNIWMSDLEVEQTRTLGDLLDFVLRRFPPATKVDPGEFSITSCPKD